MEKFEGSAEVPDLRKYLEDLKRARLKEELDHAISKFGNRHGKKRAK